MAGVGRSLRLPIALSLLLSAAGAYPAKAEIVVVVARDNPVEALQANEVNDLFLGRSSRLPNGQLASPIEQTEGSAAQNEFYQRVLERSPAQMKAHWSKLVFTGRGEPPPSVAGDAAMIEALTADPRTIGYVDSSSVDERVKIVFSLATTGSTP